MVITSPYDPDVSEPGITEIVRVADDPELIVPLAGLTVSRVGCAGVAVKLVVTLHDSWTVCDGGAPWPRNDEKLTCVTGMVQAGALLVMFIVTGIVMALVPALKPPDTVMLAVCEPALSPLGVIETVNVVAVELVVPCVGVTVTKLESEDAVKVFELELVS